jgi:hypothetical protein
MRARPLALPAPGAVARGELTAAAVDAARSPLAGASPLPPGELARLLALRDARKPDAAKHMLTCEHNQVVHRNVRVHTRMRRGQTL